jgi:hypothetical protein
MYLAPADRPAAFAELARVVRPGGHLVTAFKAGDGTLRRGGQSTGLGIAFDIYWLSPAEMERLATGAGFTPVFWAGRCAEEADEMDEQPQGYLVARRLLGAEGDHGGQGRDAAGSGQRDQGRRGQHRGDQPQDAQRGDRGA